PNHARLARRARLAGTRRLIPRRLEVDVAAAAGAALREDHARAVLGEIGELIVALEDDRPDRHLHHEVLTRRAVLILVAAVLAAPRLVGAPVLEVEKRRRMRIGDEPHAAAVAAVASRRSTAWYTILAPERGGTITAVAGLHLDDGLVDELHGEP